MLPSLKSCARLMLIAALFVMTTAVASAQTSGTVSVSASASKFVEILSGGAVSLSGNSGGGVSTDGTLNNALGVVVDLGEVGPGNTSSFVTASVPVRLRSNANYVLSMSASVASSGSTSERLTAADFGFGLTSVTRSGVGVASGSDTNATQGNPTLAANGSENATSGRYEYVSGASLANYSASTTILSGPRIMNAVPRTNTNGLNANAVFAVKPQFYENGNATATVTFTIAAP